MSKRSTRVQVARETLAILKEGGYTHPSGQRIRLRAEQASACSRSLLYCPDQFSEVFQRCDELLQSRPPTATTFEVVNETTLHAGRRLLEQEPGARVLALNFASARHLGGGFLNGSQAQEESLARASGLYPCIAQHRQMYDANAHFPSTLYTDHMIYSPDVPVFRDDEDELLESIYFLSFVTAPAVNVGARRKNEPGGERRIEPVMLSRMEKVLSLAVVAGHEHLVLGAWGCGVFANDPQQVAGWFHQHLTGAGIYAHAFRKVVFAVLDRTADQSVVQPFARYFGGEMKGRQS
jgi:uncharacterized protein (TIGR02452 family)